MAFAELLTFFAGCLLAQHAWHPCLDLTRGPQVAAAHVPSPTLTGEAIDVRLTAESAYVWDMATHEVMYAKNMYQERPIASLSKLLTAAVIRNTLPLDRFVPIPDEARAAQRRGAHISLPIGEHAQVRDLLEAMLVSSANDAAVTLAHAAFGSEEAFVEHANAYALMAGLRHTVASNATGLQGGVQHSTAQDVAQLLQMAYRDEVLASFLAQDKGVLTTQEGSRRRYTATNELLGTYLPILAGKTGYTVEAGESLAVVTQDNQGHTIGAVILGSRERFQDMKVLVEWIWRNFDWE
jgi:D-alanyl-D-alanine carboxypeptidase (penicillin-binding protein 5/6)